MLNNDYICVRFSTFSTSQIKIIRIRINLFVQRLEERSVKRLSVRSLRLKSKAAFRIQRSKPQLKISQAENDFPNKLHLSNFSELCLEEFLAKSFVQKI